MITPDPGSVEADVCIVGAGPVGLVLAHTLAERGRRVVVLESGDADAPLDEPRPDDHMEGAVEADGLAPLWTSRSRGVGGTARMWNTIVDDARTAKYVALEPLDFEARGDGGSPGWPFDHAELRPYLRAASATCGLAPEVWTGASGGPAGQDTRRLQRRLYAFGTRARFLDELAADVATHPSIRLLRGATAVALDTSDGGRRIRGVRWIGEGERWNGGAGDGHRVTAGTVILAAGTIETARFLLWTARGGGVPWADAPWLGRGFMEHPVDRSLELTTRSPLLCPDPGFFGPHRAPGTSRDAAGSPWRMGRLGLDPAWLRAEGLPNASVRFTTQEASPAVLDAPTARSWARRLVPGSALRRRVGDLVRGAARSLRRARGVTYRLLVDLEQWPHRDNRVELDDALDDRGLPRARLHWRWTDEDEARRERLVGEVARALAAEGWGAVRRLPGVSVDPNAHHHAGTTRMHADPGAGVVDASLRVHGTENLYVCGASVFPTAGALNPTLTVVALALRLADHLSTPPRPDAG